MTAIETIIVAFSMYSALPVPQFEWNEKNMKYAMCAFPLVGLVTGLAEWAAWAFCQRLSIPHMMEACLLCLIPVLITGGIHLDGYSDTSDALASHADIARKQEIMKDPHVGSFAVIRICIWFLFSFSLWYILPEYDPLVLGLSFFISRCLSGIAICTFPLAKKTGLVYMFATAADKKRSALVLEIMLVLGCAVLLSFGRIAGVCVIIAAGLTFGHYYATCMRQFGGISGDLAGWFLQKCELWTLAAVCAYQLLF